MYRFGSVFFFFSANCCIERNACYSEFVLLLQLSPKSQLNVCAEYQRERTKDHVVPDSALWRGE